MVALIMHHLLTLSMSGASFEKNNLLENTSFDCSSCCVKQHSFHVDGNQKSYQYRSAGGYHYFRLVWLLYFACLQFNRTCKIWNTNREKLLQETSFICYILSLLFNLCNYVWVIENSQLCFKYTFFKSSK